MQEFLAQYGSFLWLGVIMVAFYLLLIRPQQKQQKQRLTMLQELKVGDKILNHAGIIGTITEIKDDRVMVRIADKVEVTMIREGVARVLSK
ncbi:MAG: preprotein translocase subunit YajC [Bacillota bacterium]|jgi:preprotein translocase subunit YajC